jgi:hypothetical protein
MNFEYLSEFQILIMDPSPRNEYAVFAVTLYYSIQIKI